MLGRTHPSYATNLNNLAGLLESQGDQTGARLLYERALAIYKETFGERHAEYTITLNNLAYLLGSQDEFAAARPLFERALAIRKDVYGEKHPFYATSLDNLAVLLDKQGDYRAARPLHEAALAIRREVLGEHHPDCATSLNNLANLFERQGDYVAASRYYEQALAINKDARGERHPATVASLANLSLLLWEQRDYARAERLMRQTLEFAAQISTWPPQLSQSASKWQWPADWADTSTFTSRWHLRRRSRQRSCTAACSPPRVRCSRGSDGPATTVGCLLTLGLRRRGGWLITSRPFLAWLRWPSLRRTPSKPQPGRRPWMNSIGTGTSWRRSYRDRTLTSALTEPTHPSHPSNWRRDCPSRHRWSI